MILVLLSFFQFNIDLNSYGKNSIITNNLDVSIRKNIGWFFGAMDGGLIYDYIDGSNFIGGSNFYIKGGFSRDLRNVNVNLYPLYHVPGGEKVDSARYFSIKDQGIGIGAGTRFRFLTGNVKINLELMEFLTPSNISNINSTSINSEIQFNRDTLNFVLGLSAERFSWDSGRAFTFLYIKPGITLTKWKHFSLNMGVSFRVTNGTKPIDELNERGINTTGLGIPPWKFHLGINSPEPVESKKKLFPLKIVMTDEAGNPASGLISLADSGSFRIENGAISFNLPEDIYHITAYSSEDYLPSDTTIILKKPEEILFKLKEKKSYGIVHGTVSDDETGEPLEATITVEDIANKNIYTDPRTGDYEMYLPPGDYILQAVAEDYYPKTLTIEVMENEKAELNFKLFPRKDQ